MNEDIPNELDTLFYKHFAQAAKTVSLLPVSGSNRRYYRMQCYDIKVIGVYNIDRKENEAFLNFTKHFLSKGFSVPEIIAENLDKNVYILEDLGNETLFSYRSRFNDFPEEVKKTYENALKELIRFQTEGIKGLNDEWCYPRAAFDSQSISWDLNYFKYYFLKLANLPFDEQLLENDFHSLTKHLLEADGIFFLFRDFQSRNIMIKDGKLFFIDYQGGRRGALPYDVASLLYDGKADIPQNIRKELLEFYLKTLENSKAWSVEKFRKYYPAFAIVRILQAMGSYGYRGFYEHKKHFLSSVSFALKNIACLLENDDINVEIPHLRKVLLSLPESDRLKQIINATLTVEIQSFSYRDGLPGDESGHGGGFIFDCRCVPNPGREERFKTMTGRDKEVIEYLNKEGSVEIYFEHVKNLINSAIDNYVKRGFTHLSVSFGCTGGRHRSVYFAERLSAHIQKCYPLVHVELKHLAKCNF